MTKTTEATNCGINTISYDEENNEYFCRICGKRFNQHFVRDSELTLNKKDLQILYKSIEEGKK